MPNPPQRYKLQLSDHWMEEYKTKYKSKAIFHYKYVGFGLEDDEVNVAAWLNGSNLVLQGEFRSLFKGELGHLMDSSSDAQATFGLMEWDLKMTAVRPDA